MGSKLAIDWLKLIKKSSSLTEELYKLLLNTPEESLKSAQSEIKDILDRFWQNAIYQLPYHELENSEEVRPWIRIQALLTEKEPSLAFTNYHYADIYQLIKDQYFAEEKNLEPSALISLLIESANLVGPIPNSLFNLYPLSQLNEIEEKSKTIELLTVIFYLIHCQLTEKQLRLLPLLIHFAPMTNQDEFKMRAKSILNCLLNKETLLQFLFANEEIKKMMERSLENSSLFQLIALAASPPGTIKSLIFVLNKLLKLDRLQPTPCLNLTNQIRAVFETFALNNKNKLFLEKALICIRLEAYIYHREASPQKNNSYSPFTMQVKIEAARQKIAELQGNPSHLSYFHQLALDQGDLEKVIHWQLEKFREEEEFILSEKNKTQLQAYFETAFIRDPEDAAKTLFELFYPDGATANQTLALALWLKELNSQFTIKDFDLFDKALTFLRCKAYYVYRNNGENSQSWLSIFSKGNKLDAVANQMNKLKTSTPQPTTTSWFSFFSDYIPNVDSLAAQEGELRHILSGQIRHFEKPEQGENLVSFMSK